MPTNSVTAVEVERREPKVPKCHCGHIACVCDILERHQPGCKFRRSATCPVGIECEHGRDVCPICDPCTCIVRIPAQEPKE